MDIHGFQPARHTSNALRHLRVSVSVCAWLVAAALTLQMLTWGLVNYTDWRHEQITPKASETPTVVASGRPSPGTGSGEDAALAASDPNVGLSHYDVWFRLQHQLGLALGVIAAIGLLIQTSMATAVAAGASIRGVAQIVSAQAWSVALLGLTMPWHRLFPEFPFPGVFTTYEMLCRESEAQFAGDAGFMAALVFHGRHLVLPLTAVGITLLIGLRFEAGVETGIIPGGPTPEELRLDREASNRAAGSLVTAGRVGGALRATIGGHGPSLADPDSVEGHLGVGAAGPLREKVTQPGVEPPLRRPI